MTTYIYAVSDEHSNHVHTIVGASLKGAQEKLIEKYRDIYEIDEEFTDYRDFKNFMIDEYEIVFSDLTDIDIL